MCTRFCLSVSAAVAVAACTMSVVGHAQTASPPPATAIISGWHAQFTKNWTPPRTPWGDPDLQGNFTWVDELNTPMERPAEFEGRSLTDITPAEMDAVNKRHRAQAAATGGAGSVPTGWYEYEYMKNTRAWYVIDPPDGKLPPLTAAAAVAQETDRRVRALDGSRPPELTTSTGQGTASSRNPKGTNLATYFDWSLWDRCIGDRSPVARMIPMIYGNSLHIVQTRDYVMMRTENLNSMRIIPLEGRGKARPHISGQLRSYFGDSIGRWEGTMLVVETVHAAKMEPVFGAPAATTRTIERFTRRTAPAGIEYTATIINPDWWVRPWTFQQRLTEDDRQLVFEYSCHETNYSIVNALSGARDEERREAQRRAKAEQRAKDAAQRGQPPR